MCGIVAMFSDHGPFCAAALEAATTALIHGGPDTRVGLGHARLSIIDLATGDQPIANEDGRIRQVRVDPEVHTIVWPNGADFDPATLHDWPEHAAAFVRKAQEWARRSEASVSRH